MRVLLVNPPSYAPSPLFLDVHFGLLNLHAVLTHQGHVVKILDCNIYGNPRATLLSEIERFAYDLVGFTSYTANFENAWHLAQEVRKEAHGITLAIGGPHVSVRPVDATGSKSPFDFVARGAGEEAMLWLANRAGRRPANVVSKKGSVPASSIRGCTHLRGDLTRHFDAFPLEIYLQSNNSTLSHMTSMGCMFPCRFCCVPMLYGKQVIFDNADRIIYELRRLRLFGCRTIVFRDDFFGISERKIAPILRYLSEAGMKWEAETRIDSLSKKKLEAWVRSGLTRLRIGIESFNPTIRRSLGKPLSGNIENRRMKELLETVPEVRFNIMIGTPDDTEETVHQTIDTISSLTRQYANARFNINIFTPIPGSEYYENSARYGITFVSRKWSDFRPDRTVIRTKHLDAEQIQTFYEMACYVGMAQ